MSVKSVLKDLDIMPDKKEQKILKSETKNVISLIKEGIKNEGIDARVFLGGSFAKGTLIRGNSYDVDIFVRFSWKHEELSKHLEKIVKKAFEKKYKIKKVHGSRDYFRVYNDEKIVFEIIPVTRIKKPIEARNVTDLSYFHVKYVKGKIRENKKLAREISIAKQFFKANRVYGAESYVSGFSGYALECLVINYGGFEKMLKSLIKVENRVVLDPEKKYNKKDDALFDLNESKLHSPIILIDPTWKERNVVAALNRDTFDKFKVCAKKFLKKPSKGFFEKSEVNPEDIKKTAEKGKGEFLHIKLETNRQEGDIAGTKLKKFANHLEFVLSKRYEILEKEFVYNEKKGADAYFVVKSKKEIIKEGPPIGMTKNVKDFKKKNKNVFEKEWKLYAKIKVNASAKKFLEDFKKDNADKVKDMNILDFKII